MKKILLFIISISLFQIATAQEFDIREFRTDPTDVTLRVAENQKKTRNGEQAALIKVITNIKGLQFESNIGIVDVKQQQDGYWVYVVPRERRITLMAKDYLSQDVSLPEPAQSLTVYRLVVAAKGALPTMVDLVRVTFRLNESDVFIRTGNSAPIKAAGNSAVFNLPRGQHTFRFIKDGFSEEELSLDVQEEMVRDVTLQAGTVTTQFALSGFVLINSEPAGADVYLNDQRMGVTPYQGRHIAGDYSLRLSYPLYYDHSESFQLNEGATINLPPATLKPRFGYWQVTSTPSDAEVYLDDKYIGNTPLSRAQISSGLHQLKVRKTLYHEHTENFTIQDGDDERFNISLNPAFGRLTITSDPAGAKVYVEGREVGVTPYTNTQQPSGSYNIRLSMELYSDARDQAVVRDGEETEKFIPLNKNFGTLKISAPEADIYVDGRPAGKATYSANLPPGQYKVKAVRPLHKDDEREVFVVVGQTETLELSPTPRLGAVSIATQPFDARNADIYINGTKRKETTPAVIPLLIGKYDIRVKKQGYLETSKSVDVKEGREEEVVFDMQTFEGSMAQQVRRHKTKKVVFGTASLVALGTGGYFLQSANSLSDEYKIAGNDATKLFDDMEQHRVISYAAFGVAIPLAVIAIVQNSKQKQAERKINFSVVPTTDGMMAGVTLKF